MLFLYIGTTIALTIILITGLKKVNADFSKVKTNIGLFLIRNMTFNDKIQMPKQKSKNGIIKRVKIINIVFMESRIIFSEWQNESQFNKITIINWQLFHFTQDKLDDTKKYICGINEYMTQYNLIDLGLIESSTLIKVYGNGYAVEQIIHDHDGEKATGIYKK